MLNLDHFITARAALARSRAQRRAERFDRPIHGDSHDAPDMIEIGEYQPAPPIAFHILYSDARRNITGRCITLRGLKLEIGEIRLSAICHLRNAMRTFVASRVVETTDLATGEVHEDGLAYFGTHPLLRTMTADDLAAMSPALMAIQECRDEIILLSFVAAADGTYDLDEQNAVVTHVLDRCPDEGVTEGEVRSRIRGFVPDEQAFWRALDRMCAGGGDARSLMRSLRRVVDADGEVDAEEVAFVGEIETRLQDAGRL